MAEDNQTSFKPMKPPLKDRTRREVLGIVAGSVTTSAAGGINNRAENGIKEIEALPKPLPSSIESAKENYERIETGSRIAGAASAAGTVALVARKLWAERNPPHDDSPRSDIPHR